MAQLTSDLVTLSPEIHAQLIDKVNLMCSKLQATKEVGLTLALMTNLFKLLSHLGFSFSILPKKEMKTKTLFMST